MLGSKCLPQQNPPMSTFIRLSIVVCAVTGLLTAGDCVWARANDATHWLVQMWNPQDEVTLACVVDRGAGDTGELRIRKAAQEIFRFSPDLTPLSIFPTDAANSRLVTIWVSGSGAYRVFIFSYRSGKVIQVLDADSKAMPEFVYGASANTQRVIISNGEWTVDDRTGVARLRPTSADVYEWDGTSYSVTKGVPWTKRLR